eukprot:jgi/Bigna1/90146/estExt_fgenesh1_pg.C_630075
MQFGLVAKSDGEWASSAFAQAKKVPAILLKTEKEEVELYSGELNMPAISAWLVEKTGIEMASPEAAARKAKAANEKRQKQRAEEMKARQTVHRFKNNDEFEAICAKGSVVCAVTFASPGASEGEASKTAELMQTVANRYAKKASSPFRFGYLDGTDGNKAISAFRSAFEVSDDLTTALVALVPKRNKFKTMMGVFDEEHVVEFLDNLVRANAVHASVVASKLEFQCSMFNVQCPHPPWELELAPSSLGDSRGGLKRTLRELRGG